MLNGNLSELETHAMASLIFIIYYLMFVIQSIQSIRIIKDGDNFCFWSPMKTHYM